MRENSAPTNPNQAQNPSPDLAGGKPRNPGNPGNPDKTGPFTWKLHGDGKSIGPGEVVQPQERLSWPRTIGIGSQHIVAMFGATFLVPLLTGFSPATTLFFTGIGTLLFILITAGRLPSYLGSSFALIAPIGAVTGYVAGGGAPLDPAKMALAQGGVISAGTLLLVVGLIVHWAGAGWIDRIMPPMVTGAIVSLIGFNLAPAAWNNVKQAPVTATVTIVTVLLVTVLFKGIIGRLSILIGVLMGYVTAIIRGEVKFDAIEKADWVGLPQFHAPAFDPTLLGLFLPVVLVLEPWPDHFTAANVGGYLYLCLVGAVLAYVLYFRGISRLPPAIVSSLGPLSPVCAFVLGWVFLNEQLGGRALVGFVLVLLSIIGVQRAMMPRTGTTSTSLSRHDS